MLRLVRDHPIPSRSVNSVWASSNIFRHVCSIFRGVYFPVFPPEVVGQAKQLPPELGAKTSVHPSYCLFTSFSPHLILLSLCNEMRKFPPSLGPIAANAKPDRWWEILVRRVSFYAESCER